MPSCAGMAAIKRREKDDYLRKVATLSMLWKRKLRNDGVKKDVGLRLKKEDERPEQVATPWTLHSRQTPRGVHFGGLIRSGRSIRPLI